MPDQAGEADHAVHTDDRLIALAVGGDTAAFGELVARYQGEARRLATVLVGPSDADDVAQEAFIRSYRSLALFRRGSPFAPWLMRIVANQASNHRRGASRRLRRTISAGARAAVSAPGADIDVGHDDQRALLIAALDELRTGEREVLVLRYLLDYSEEETAAVLGCPRGTVKSRSARALRKLRARIEPLDRASEVGAP